MMEHCEKSLLNRIAEARFCCVELQLYLDTHPDDAVAQADFACYAEKLGQLVEAYEQEYGALLNFGASQTACEQRVFGAWPWQ